MTNMVMKVKTASGRQVTYHRNLTVLRQSFDQAGIRYQLIETKVVAVRSPR